MTNADCIRQATDEELAKFIVRQLIRGAIHAHGIYDMERIKSIEDVVINSACWKKDIETTLNMLRQEVNEDAEKD